MTSVRFGDLIVGQKFLDPNWYTKYNVESPVFKKMLTEKEETFGGVVEYNTEGPQGTILRFEDNDIIIPIGDLE